MSKKSKREDGSLRGYLHKIVAEARGTLFSGDEQTDALVKTGRLLDNLQKEVFNKSTQHWFEYLVNEAGILAYIMQQDDKAWLMNKLTCLFDYIKESTHRRPKLTLKELVQQIDLLADNGLPLPLVQTTGTETGVNLLTSHGSKGLEYESVFVIGARNDLWEAKRKNNRGFKLPHNVLEQETESETTEELRRLFFVAITRAEKHLFISYPQMKNDGKLLEPSQFVEEIKAPLDLQLEPITLTADEKLLFSGFRFGIIQQPVLAQGEKDYIDRLLQGFVMNVTALNNYLDCPLKFYYSNLIRVPSAKSEAAQFGSAVHDALADFLNKMMDNSKVYPDKQFLLERFLYQINNGREVFTRESLQRFTEYGEEVMAGYYDKYYQPAPQGDFIRSDCPLTKVVLNDIPLKGFADKIQFWKNDIVITDFKTGSMAKSNRRFEFARPGEKAEKMQGGNYWRQAVFYKILAENLPNKHWNVLHVQFDFIEPNDKNDFDIVRLNITPAEMDAVKEQLTDCWKQIQLHNFYKGCGKPDCEWCNFAKNNKLYLHLEETEEDAITV